MNRHRLPPRKATPAEDSETGEIRRVFRRFFDLIGRLERAPRKGQAEGDEPPAPEVKARITRLDPTRRVF